MDALRAGADAILIGATTMRRDNPQLLVNSAQRRADRVARGLPAYPMKVAVTRGGELDPGLRFRHHGGAKLIHCPEVTAPKLRERLGHVERGARAPGARAPAPGSRAPGVMARNAERVASATPVSIARMNPSPGAIVSQDSASPPRPP